MRWARILLPSLAGCVYRRLLQFKILSPTAPHPFLKMGKYFFMVCCCSLLSQMPWDHRPLGTSSWVQVWWMLWSSKFSDLWVERWRGKLEKGKEKRNTLVWLAVCLKRGSCVLSKVRYHLKTGLLCKQLASSRREEISWLNKCSPPPTQWKDAWTWALTGFLAPQGLCPCCALCLEALLCLSQGRWLIFQALRSEWHFLALLADLSNSLPSPPHPFSCHFCQYLRYSSFRWLLSEYKVEEGRELTWPVYC